MGFVQFCVGAIISILLYLASGMVGVLFSWNKNDDEAVYMIAWIISTIGFGVCLTMLLYQNGIIK